MSTVEPLQKPRSTALPPMWYVQLTMKKLIADACRRQEQALLKPEDEQLEARRAEHVREVLAQIIEMQRADFVESLFAWRITRGAP